MRRILIREMTEIRESRESLNVENSTGLCVIRYRPYGKEYAEPITLDEAREMARTVLTLYAVIMRPLPDEQKSMRRQREKQKKRRLRTSQRAS